jgi:uncharacterized protein
MLNVKCPSCKIEFPYHSSPSRPFCSERCRLIDLGQWLDESYAVPAEKMTEEEQEKLIQILEEQNEEN